MWIWNKSQIINYIIFVENRKTGRKNWSRDFNTYTHTHNEIEKGRKKIRTVVKHMYPGNSVICRFWTARLLIWLRYYCGSGACMRCTYILYAWVSIYIECVICIMILVLFQIIHFLSPRFFVNFFFFFLYSFLHFVFHATNSTLRIPA